MLRKIISGGQTGVDRAALDVALEHGIPCGGWCPKGRLAEDGTIPAHYPLAETHTTVYEERTAWNVRDSDGSLVVTWGPPAGGTAYTIDAAREYGRPCLVIDLAEDCESGGVRAWIEEHDIQTLNVAGPRASKDPSVYDEAAAFLGRVLRAAL